MYKRDRSFTYKRLVPGHRRLSRDRTKELLVKIKCLRSRARNRVRGRTIPIRFTMFNSRLKTTIKHENIDFYIFTDFGQLVRRERD